MKANVTPPSFDSPASGPTPGPAPAGPAEPQRGRPGAAALPIAGACCALVALGAVVVDQPVSSDDGSGLLACPTRQLTGFWCPGCGLTRATQHLARGNIGQALSFNLLTPVVLSALAVLWFVWFSMSTGRGVPHRVASIRARWYVAGGAVFVGFTIVRNLPGFEALRGG